MFDGIFGTSSNGDGEVEDDNVMQEHLTAPHLGVIKKVRSQQIHIGSVHIYI